MHSKQSGDDACDSSLVVIYFMQHKVRALDIPLERRGVTIEVNILVEHYGGIVTYGLWN